MHYQTILIAIIVLMLAVDSYRTVLAQPASPSTARPNVILILADDLGYNDLGVYGSPDALTPNIDALAQEGVYFRQFYSGAPACTPTRYMLLTGRDVAQANNSGLHKAIIWNERDVGIGSEITLADVLNDVGYDTAIIGKWHLGHGDMPANPPETGAPDSQYHPNNHGFDYFYGCLTGAIDYNTHWVLDLFPDWWENKQSVADQVAGRYATTLITEKAVQYISEHADSANPFFLYLPYTAPHFGMTVDTSPIVRTQLPIGEEDRRDYLSRFDHIYPSDRNVRKRYLAMVAALDDDIGRIVASLAENGLRENTMIIFLSDNGGDPTYGGSNLPLRGRKGQMYEGGIRVPLIVNWDGVLPGGRESWQMAVSKDILPTVLKLSQIDRPLPIDGVDLSEHLIDGVDIERDVQTANQGYGVFYIHDQWKFLVRPLATAELFDLANDPGEATNLAAHHTATLNELGYLYQNWILQLQRMHRTYFPVIGN